MGAEYAPQNFYCYAMDKNLNETFKARMRKLASCFKNVFVVDNLSIYKYGREQIEAHLACFTKLLKYEWKYAFVLGV